MDGRLPDDVSTPMVPPGNHRRKELAVTPGGAVGASLGGVLTMLRWKKFNGLRRR